MSASWRREIARAAGLVVVGALLAAFSVTGPGRAVEGALRTWLGVERAVYVSPINRGPRIARAAAMHFEGGGPAVPVSDAERRALERARELAAVGEVAAARDTLAQQIASGPELSSQVLAIESAVLGYLARGSVSTLADDLDQVSLGPDVRYASAEQVRSWLEVAPAVTATDDAAERKRRRAYVAAVVIAADGLDFSRQPVWPLAEFVGSDAERLMDVLHAYAMLARAEVGDAGIGHPQ